MEKIQEFTIFDVISMELHDKLVKLSFMQDEAEEVVISMNTETCELLYDNGVLTWMCKSNDKWQARFQDVEVIEDEYTSFGEVKVYLNKI